MRQTSALSILRHDRAHAPGADPTRDVFPPNFVPRFRFPHVHPTHKPVDGAALADDIAALFARHLSAPAELVDALTLWALHAWCYEASEISPRLALVSPEARTGKTTALRLLALLTPRALFLGRADPRTLLAVIDRFRPTLMLDDADAFMLARREMRGLLTMGFACDGHVLAPGAHMGGVPTQSCAAPVAFATAQTLPREIAERAIALTFHPAPDDARRERLPLTAPPEICVLLNARAARFAIDHHATLADGAPQMPNALARAARENWRPLFAIADALSPAWGERARAAALAIASVSPYTANATELLADIRRAFEMKRETRMASVDLIAILTGEAESPWLTSERGRKLHPRGLALRLERLGIRPRTLRTAEGFVRGYLARDFARAFALYLGDATAQVEEIH